MKDLKFVCAQPDDFYFKYQVHTWIESLRKLGHSDKAIILIFTPKDRERNTKWDDLVATYPEAEWFFYKDTDNISNYLGTYIPVLRPYILAKYWEKNPDMKDKAVFYSDCDIVFTENFKIDQFLDDDIAYLSDTKGYINATYFDSKRKDVLPDKLSEYDRVDVLDGACKVVGVSRAIAEKNNDHSGGAQYLLKNIDAQFWRKVTMDCISIVTYLRGINRKFFQSEAKGYQAWCADMWSVLWNLWLNDIETRIVPELDFAWSTDPITKLDKVGILHNAGVTSTMHGDTPMFYKGKYHNNTNPFIDPHLQKVLNDENNKKLCNHHYLEQMLETYNKYKLKY